MDRGSAGFSFWIVALPFLAGLISSAYAQQNTTVGRIDIRGTTVFTHDEIVGSFATKTGSSYVANVFQSDLDGLIARYRDDGYYYARIDSVSSRSDAETLDLIMSISEGKRSFVDTIGVIGDSVLSEQQIRYILTTKEGSPFIQKEVEEGARAIAQFYEDSGFPLAKVVINDVTMTERDSSYLVRFTYKIVEGKRVVIKELRVEGNTSTRNSVIIREARLRGNELYSERLSATIKHRLDMLQLFSSVSQPELFLNQHEDGGLLVRVHEGNPNRFDGIVGYVPSPRPGVPGFLTGLIDLQFRNLFGTARRLAARWSREDQGTQELGLQYFEPWIASYPVSGLIGFTQRIQDSTYVRRQIDLSLNFSLSDQLSIGGIYSQTNVIPSQSYGKNILAESQGRSVGLSVTYDTRSDPVTPLSGIYYKTEYDLGTKDIHGSSLFAATSNSTQRVLMDLNYFVEPFLNQVVAEGAHIQDFRSNLIELGDLFRIGGASTLRGYREGQFLGSRLVWSNLEYRFLVAQRSYFYGFFDAAYIVTPGQPLAGLQGSQETKLGYGVGIRMDSNLGLIGVSIGFGEGDTFSTAKLHIQLINAF